MQQKPLVTRAVKLTRNSYNKQEFVTRMQNVNRNFCSKSNFDQCLTLGKLGIM